MEKSSVLYSLPNTRILNVEGEFDYFNYIIKWMYMKYNIIFSIPIHEKLEVVLDQVYNFKCFNPKSAIVFHISKGFNYQDSHITKSRFEEEIKQIGDVYINPESVRTGFADIIQAHISNFKYISSILDFDYFSLCASNELFVKRGLYEHINIYDCGLEKKSIENCIFKQSIIEDTDLAKYTKGDYSKIFFSHVEGTFYNKTIFSTIISKITDFYDYNCMQSAYPREEVYFSTILWSDEEFRKDVRVLEDALFTYVPWNRKNGKIDVRIREIKKILKKDSPFYSVKRVRRSLNDYVRSYVRYISEINNIYPKLGAEIHGPLYYYYIELWHVIRVFCDNFLLDIKRTILRLKNCK